MNIEQEIRAQIEKNKGLKLAVGEINNHLSILEGLLRNERDDVQKQVNDAYQRGLEDGKAQSEGGCEGCRFEGTICTACENCCNMKNAMQAFSMLTEGMPVHHKESAKRQADTSTSTRFWRRCGHEKMLNQ